MASVLLTLNWRSVSILISKYIGGASMLSCMSLYIRSSIQTELKAFS